MQRHEERGIASLWENQAGARGPELNMPLSRHLQKAVRETRLRVEPGCLLPYGVTDVMLFCAQADLFPGHHLTKVLVSPGARQLT